MNRISSGMPAANEPFPALSGCGSKGKGTDCPCTGKKNLGRSSLEGRLFRVCRTQSNQGIKVRPSPGSTSPPLGSGRDLVLGGPHIPYELIFDTAGKRAKLFEFPEYFTLFHLHDCDSPFLQHDRFRGGPPDFGSGAWDIFPAWFPECDDG